jgi:hypothetical protein
LQLRALTTAQVRALATEDIAGLGTDQIKALTTTQLCALTSSQIQALSSDQVVVLPQYTPLMIDLDGDGVETRSIAEGVQFDLDGNGSREATGWVGVDDGLIVRDLDADGRIETGAELFGEATRLPDGSTARDGFEALAALDQNRDGVVDASDPAFLELKVWQDLDADGRATASELSSLSERGVVALNLSPDRALRQDQGNLIALTSQARRSDGTQVEVADVWLLTARAESASDPASSVADALERYAAGLANVVDDGPRTPAGSALIASALISDPTVDALLSALSEFGSGSASIGTAELKRTDALVTGAVALPSLEVPSAERESQKPDDPALLAGGKL